MIFPGCGKLTHFKEQYENYRTGVESTESADQSPVAPIEAGDIPGNAVGPVSEDKSEESGSESLSVEPDSLQEADVLEPAEQPPQAEFPALQMSREVCEKLRSERSSILQSAVSIGNGRRVEQQSIVVAAGKVLMVEVNGNDNEISISVGANPSDDSNDQAEILGACVLVVGNASNVEVQLSSRLRSVHLSVVGNSSEIELGQLESGFIGTVSKYIRGNRSLINIEADPEE